MDPGSIGEAAVQVLQPVQGAPEFPLLQGLALALVLIAVILVKVMRGRGSRTR